MNTVQNGKGDRPRNNWGLQWYEGYTAIDWHRKSGSSDRDGEQQSEDDREATSSKSPASRRHS